MTNQTTSAHRISEWKQAVAKFQDADNRQGIWQIINSAVPYVVLWYLAYLALDVSYWLTLAIAVVAAGFLIRVFIIFHDCGHGSFFASQKANDAVGVITGILTFTPYFDWRHSHALHHASAGDLDRRGKGDVWTLTIEEYRALPRTKKFAYRIYRSPFIMLGIGALLEFLVFNRFPGDSSRSRERNSVHWTNLALLVIAVVLSLLIGFRAYVLVQLPILLLAATFGVWLFYVQHQFEGVYWARHEEWDYVTAAMEGCSYYKLPRLLQWFSGNIGFHHIHHLSPKIPNYRLEACYKANPMLQDIKPLTLATSLKSLRLRLWDEASKQLVGFNALKTFKDA